MKRWPLKLKTAAFAALLSMLTLGLTAAVSIPYIYFAQVKELDETLTENGEDLFTALEAQPGGLPKPGKPVSARFVPVPLRGRYIQLDGPDGKVVFRTPNLSKAPPLTTPPGMSAVRKNRPELKGALQTVVLLERNCRIGTFQKGDFTVHVGTRMGTIEGMQEDLRNGFLTALPFVGLLVFGGGWLVAHRAVKPVRDLTEAAERISAEKPDERLPVPESRDEIARLSLVLNASYDRLQKSYQAAARFSANASHQLKTPVSIMRIALDSLRKSALPDEAQREAVTDLLQQTRRMTTMIEDLLLLAQADAGRLAVEVEPLDLLPLIEAMLDDTGVLAELAEVKVETELPESLMSKADARRVALILQNLGENAVKYNQPGGTVRVSAREEDGMAVVRVANTGRAIEAADRERIFERFHRGTVAEEVKGHGLGLNIARELARAHDGELELAPAEEGWTTFVLRLPRP